jgi:hypothetical protein
MSVGTSEDPRPDIAGEAAVSGALAGRVAALVMIFVSPTYDMQAIASAAARAAQGMPLVGCSTSGEIADGTGGSGRVVAVALGGDGIEAHASMGLLAEGASAAGGAAAQGLLALTQPHRVLVLLADGLAGEHASVVRGAYAVGGAAVKLAGGCAGDELEMAATWQIFGDRAYTGAVVGAAIGSVGPMGIGVGHGWRPTGEPMVVTESDGSQVFRIDDQPALDHYLKSTGAPPEAYNDPAAWHGHALERPLGLPRPGGDEVRAVLGADYERRSLFCGDVPQGSMIRLMEGDAESVLRGTETAVDQSIEGLDGSPAIGFIAFDCAARRNILGEQGVHMETTLLAQRAGNAPVAGFYTYGEVARRTGSRGVHSATLVLLALG